MNEFRADLHCHSTCSDGTSSPEKIVELAAKIGLAALSITDHDTIEAYKTAIPAAEKIGIQILTGVELSSIHNGVSIHILAYGFSIDDPTIHQFCVRHHQRRQERNRIILELLAKHQMPISEDEIRAVLSSDIEYGHHTIGRPHIAQAMINKGYVESINEAFHKYLGEGKSCYSQGESFSTQETIDVIHEAKALAVIAHPHLINNSSILKSLLSLNFDGIECYYAKFPSQAHKRWTKIANHRNLLITGGSDYHGEIKPHIPLGASWIDQEKFDLLKNQLARKYSNV